MARGWQSSTAIRPNLTIWPTSSCARTSVRCLRPSSRASAANPNSHHIAARVFANFGFKSGTRVIGFASVPLIPRFASSAPQVWANLGIGTLALLLAGGTGRAEEAFTPQQVDLGRVLYARNCSPCHGPRMQDPESAFDLR